MVKYLENMCLEPKNHFDISINCIRDNSVRDIDVQLYIDPCSIQCINELLMLTFFAENILQNFYQRLKIILLLVRYTELHIASDEGQLLTSRFLNSL